MAVNEDVQQIVSILDEEGFGAVAGELLMEINLGKEVDPGDSDENIRDNPASDDDGLDHETRPKREPIPDNEQLGEAIRFLRFRLVEPVRRLAEAERITAELLRVTAREQEKATAITATRITFVDSSGEPASGFTRDESKGEQQSAQKLDAVFARILTQEPN